MTRALILCLALCLAACVPGGAGAPAPPAADDIAVAPPEGSPEPEPAPEAAPGPAPEAEPPASDGLLPANYTIAMDPDAIAAEVQAGVAPPDDVAAIVEEAADSAAEGEAAPEAEPEIPPEIKSEAQIACERRGGTWGRVAAGSEFRACVKRTRDDGQRCRTGRDCDGECLARSGTCAPVTPLFGCNDILDDTGRQMTLCVD
jgi:hypothetical protein